KFKVEAALDQPAEHAVVPRQYPAEPAGIGQLGLQHGRGAEAQELYLLAAMAPANTHAALQIRIDLTGSIPAPDADGRAAPLTIGAVVLPEHNVRAQPRTKVGKYRQREPALKAAVGISARHTHRYFEMRAKPDARPRGERILILHEI